MIGKTTKGSGFGGLLRYVFEKEGAEYLGGNMAGRTPTELTPEFRAVANRNHRVQIPVAHISFSPSPNEQLDDIEALEFAERYLEEIGFNDCQWVLAKHDDTQTPDEQDRPHYHIIANRVRMSDLKVVSAWHDWERSERALRKLEKEFGLIEVQPSWEIDRAAPSTGQQRRYKKEQEQYEAGQRDAPPECPIQVQLQAAIDQATVDQPTMPELINRLKDSGIDAQIVLTRTGQMKGIKYQMDSQWFSGTQLGAAYTFNGKGKGLEKHRQVKYSPEQKGALIAASARTPLTPEVISQRKAQQQQEGVEAIAPILANYLNYVARKTHYEGTKYTVSWEEPILTLTERENKQPIMKAMWDKQKGWLDLGSNLSPETVNYFVEEVKPRVEEVMRMRFEQAAQQKHKQLLERRGWER